MKRIAAATLLALCSIAAQAFDCLPSTAATPLATGTATRTVSTAAGAGDAWWCLLPIRESTPAGKVEYRANFFVVLNKYRSATAFAAAAARVAAAAEPFAAVRNEVAAATVTPAPGSRDEYDFNLLHYRACLALTTPPLLAPIDPLPSDWCGVEPVPPEPIAGVWTTPAAGTFTLYTAAGGKLTGIVAGRKAPAGVTCDCTTPVLSGSSTYCALANAAASEVTLCRKAVP